MRAAVLRNGQLVVRDDVPVPVPEFGQVLVDVKACGICGSDLHFAKHGASMLALGEEMQGIPDMGRTPPDLSRDIFMGHEFSAAVIEAGPDTIAPKPGTLVTSIPIMLTMTGVRDLVYSNDLPAGYSEQMVLSAPMLVEVPNGLDPQRAALTEPMAVGLHAVNRSNIAAGEGALVLGCGPVGLAVIAALHVRGIEPIVAADFSPARRALAVTMGAHEAVDPASEPSFDAWTRAGKGRTLVVFEAIGVPGIIDDVLRCAPPQSRVVVVGVCMGRDTITPFWAIGKELNIQFVLGYDPNEFAGSLRSIAEGQIDVAPMITAEVGLDGVPGAFDELANPERHCKILVVP
ncbi:MAG TPA: zinc-binding dehydrogenase [Acidimicrobiales bacterium]|jgi:threonine dehydrogenase-like Zn-dependent dehydrogenase|nr:zinc-binding dehydrogenase [Acidimicrobiales bacterium]